MNCCDRIVFIFALLSVMQYISRWDSDEKISSAPWQLFAVGMSNKTQVGESTDVTFDTQALAYGHPSVEIYRDKIVSTDRQEMFMLVNVNISGPPMSFHRISILVKNVVIRELSVMVSPTGKTYGSIFTPVIHVPKNDIKMVYTFEDIWTQEGDGQAFVDVVMRSGYMSLWDLKWSGVYKR